MPHTTRLLSTLACLAFGTLVPSIHAQRLSQTVRPEHYTLALTPDLKAATFAGSETIDVQLQQPTDAITLNAIEIKFTSVTVKAGGKTLTANVTEDEQKEQATFHFNQALPAGRATLNIEYSGILNDKLRGFYLSKTAKRNYAVTQFESTDARRAFPSFDEPAFKATYDVTLVVDKGDTAISNTNIVSDKPGPVDGKHTIHFAATPKMSTYLVAFLVGDFQCTTGESDGVPIRGCATPDKVELTKYAVQAAEFVLHYYDTYFGIKYPMPKLDMIAIPDFEAGAMENFGAITYRETDLLIDEKTASVGQKKNVGLVVAHEMAHQWFGDMVTMQWWDNIWLNEGFASWMENKPVAAWHPEWNIPQDVAADRDSTLNLDSQKTTRTIRAKADTPDEINEMFDGISYGKAGAVLLMVENYLGEETFRKGVHNYLAAHMYGNATAEDFWGAQTETSHKPVDKIMESFVAQPGVPMLTFGEAQGASIPVSQERFFLTPGLKADQTQAWSVPVCVKSAGGKADCDVIHAAQQPVKASSDAPFFFANAAGKGYYRSAYPNDAYAKIVSGVESGLSPEERISFIGDTWAQVRSGKIGVGDFLTLAAAVRDDSNAEVVQTALSSVATVYNRIATTDAEHAALSAWLRTNFKPTYEKLGAPSASDTPDKQELRAALFGYLGIMGNDPDVIAQSKQIAEKYLADPASVEASLATSATAVAAYSGDAALFDKLQKTFETSTDPQLQESALHMLAAFKNQELEKRTLDYTVSGKVRNQDAVIELLILMRGRETRDQAWQYIQQNWDKVQAQFTTTMGGYLVGGVGNFCSAESRDQALSFFDTHKVRASASALTRARNLIDDCIALRDAQGPKLEAWAAGQK